jgi:4-hydroxythreonine-4-phosphate dehydrogenase
MTNEKPRLAVTMGDPAGVGPEICLRLLKHPDSLALCVPIIYGDSAVLKLASERTGLPAPEHIIQPTQWEANFPKLDQPAVLDLAAVDLSTFVPGQVSAQTGQAAFTYINKAIDHALAHQVAAVSTAPIHKEALRQAGIEFPGHTEIFAHRTGAQRSCMMQYSPEITCTFVTVHVGYAEVPQILNQDRILEVIQLTAEAMRRLRGPHPKIAVCGLNPHAGEHGLFGQREEERIIIPAIEAARAEGIEVEGPLPPDTAFIPWKLQNTDAVVCMYHDQGHIPVKALAFDSAVNTTLGLPIIRTSVDHGTALDIAWQGKARPDSLYAAVKLAVKMAKQSPPASSP